jgi:hypothetical protein
MPPKRSSKRRTIRTRHAAGAPAQPRCGLCGKTAQRTRTECCGQWICDDESTYVLFSYARNSCSRNHRRYTLCGYHHVEGHSGPWQDCPHCRDAFATELYVWYGTNAYNFETLEHPPAYVPTLCAACGKRIVLGDEGYSVTGTEYLCDRCTARALPRRLR